MVFKAKEEHPKESLSDFGFQYNLIEDKDEVFLQGSGRVFVLFSYHSRLELGPRKSRI